MTTDAVRRCAAVPCGAVQRRVVPHCTVRRRIHTGCFAVYVALHCGTVYGAASGVKEPQR